MTVIIDDTNITSRHSTNDLKLGYEILISGVTPEIKDVIHNIYISPEIQSLSEITENNPWHDHENGLKHVETVFLDLQLLLEFDFVSDLDIRERYKKYFSSRIGGSRYSRIEMLLIACALHDISKGQPRPIGDVVAPGKKYLFEKEDGTTSGKGHEKASSDMVAKMLTTKNLSQEEIAVVEYLVANHDMYSMSFCEQNLTGDSNADFETIKLAQPRFWPELLLHILADEYGAMIREDGRKYLLFDILAKHGPSI